MSINICFINSSKLKIILLIGKGNEIYVFFPLHGGSNIPMRKKIEVG